MTASARKTGSKLNAVAFTLRPRGGPPASAPAWPQKKRDAGSQRDELLDHHHDPRQLLVGDRRDPVCAVVRGVERREREDEHVGQDLARSEQPRRQRDAAADAQPAMRARIHEQRPDEDSADRPAHVLEVVQARMRERRVVDVRHVPDREVRRPERRRAVGRPLVDHPVGEQPRRVARRAHLPHPFPLRARQLDPVVVGPLQRLVEHQSRPGVARGPDAFVGERFADYRPALVLRTEAARRRHAHLVEEQLVEGVVTHHRRHLGDDEALGGRRHEEHGDAGVAWGGGVGAHEQVAVVGDRGVRRPGLLAGHHVLVAVEPSARAQRGQVGAGVGLREPLAPHDLAAHDRRQQRRLLLVGAVGQDRRSDPVDVHVLRAPRLADRPQFLAEDDVLPGRGRPPAVLGRPVRRQPAALGESTVEDLRVGDVLGRSELAHRAAPLAVERRGDERAQLLTERRVLV